MGVLEVFLPKTKFSSSSYVRIYEDSSKTNLLAEITINDYPKYDVYLSNVNGGFNTIMKPFEYNGNYYLDISQDLEEYRGFHENSIYHIGIMFGNPTLKSYSGLWTSSKKLIDKINILSDNMYEQSGGEKMLIGFDKCYYNVTTNAEECSDGSILYAKIEVSSGDR